MTIGAKLKELRDSRDWTQEKLATELSRFLPKMKLQKANISGWESRTEAPSQDVINAYVKVFGVTEGQIRGLNILENLTSVKESETEILLREWKEIASGYKRELTELKKEVDELKRRK